MKHIQKIYNFLESAMFKLSIPIFQKIELNVPQ